MVPSPDPGVQLRREGEPGDGRSRVCDNCIRQKVKCDMGKPKCSRCLERDLSCTYSSTRRKPGPTPGSKRSQPGSSTVPHLRRRVDHVSPSGLHVDLPSPQSSIHVPPTASTLVTPDLAAGSCVYHAAVLLNITPEEEESLLTCYFETIHHAIPLFLHRRIPSGGGGADGEAVAACSRDLIQTLVVITAKLSGFTLLSMKESDLDLFIDRMLSSTSLQEDIAGDDPTLDQFRKSCLLVFYEYHQCPGHQAWMRIGKLVRWAYWAGLDQIDKLHQPSPRWRTLSEDELEEWRLVWWCLYCLESYANVSTGMPYEIDEQLIKTALPRGPSPGATRRVLLPSRRDGLVGLVQDIVSESPPQTAAVEIQIVSVTILRHVGRAVRLHALGAHDDCTAAAVDTERSLSALRLVLPRNFFNPRRNAFSNESAAAHHFRLVTIHHMLTAQLLLALGRCRHLEDGEAWLQSWQQVLEICQEVAAIARQWNSSFCLNVDPAVCIIAFVSVVFLDLHLKFASSGGPAALSEGLHAEIEHCQAVLLLFLEQFAKTWTLPRLLILSFKGFKESLTSPIGPLQVGAILLHFESPLHPRWLQFLQSADEILESFP